MAFTPDGIAPPGIPLLGCSPLSTVRCRSVFTIIWLKVMCNVV